MSEHIPNPTSTQPALTVGAVASSVGAVLAVLIAFGVNLTEAQTEAILGLVLIGGPVLVAALIRSKVYAPATVARLLRRQ